jgi:hypothetical protein
MTSDDVSNAFFIGPSRSLLSVFRCVQSRALCDREYGFDYEGLRKRKRLAWHPIVTPKGGIEWVPNPNCQRTNLDVRRPRDYAELGVHGHSRYEQAVRDLDRVGWSQVRLFARRLGNRLSREARRGEVDSGHSLVHAVKREYDEVSPTVCTP